jgi:hypothetical protein
MQKLSIHKTWNIAITLQSTMMRQDELNNVHKSCAEGAST